MWWLNGLHHEVASVPAGTFATLAEDFRDGQGDTRRSVQVSLVDVTPSTGGPDGSLTLRGTDAYAVRLDFRAAPDQELRPRARWRSACGSASRGMWNCACRPDRNNPRDRRREDRRDQGQRQGHGQGALDRGEGQPGLGVDGADRLPHDI